MKTENEGTSAPDQGTLKPESLLGLYLLFGVIVIVLCSWAFYSIAEDILERDAIVQIDQTVATFVHSLVTPTARQLVPYITMLGNEVVVVASAILGIILLRQRRRGDFLRLVIAVGGAEIIVVLIKLLVQRDRPVFEDPIQVINNFSFPSGHAFLAVVFYGLLAYFLWKRVPTTAARLTVIAATIAMVLLVGFTRVYLGVHFISDVLAGFLGGSAWLTISLTGVEFLHRWRLRRRFYRQVMKADTA